MWGLKWNWVMRLGSQTYKIYLTLTKRFTNHICFICVKSHINISGTFWSSEKLLYSKLPQWIQFYGTIQYFSLELNSNTAITWTVRSLLITLFLEVRCMLLTVNPASLMLWYVTYKQHKTCVMLPGYDMTKGQVSRVVNICLFMSLWHNTWTNSSWWTQWLNLSEQ